MRALRLFFIILLSLILFGFVEADTFKLDHREIDGKHAILAMIRLGPGNAMLELHWKNDDGTALKTYQLLESWLSEKRKSLLFAANSGIYRDSPSLAPIGLHIQNGRILSRLSFAKGCGNFCWYSGVFLIQENRASILPRENVSTGDLSNCRLALQSGPLFIRAGNLQGTWSDASYNLNRSAICTTKQPGELLLVLVTDSTNFMEFFDVLKKLGCVDALFLDGSVSSFYDGESRRRIGNQAEPYAGLLAVTKPR